MPKPLPLAIMKKILFPILACLSFTWAMAQNPDVKTLRDNAHSFFQQGDYSNAILLLNKALDQEPGNLEVSKDLVMAYYQKGEYPKAQTIVKALMERPDADPAVYQLGGMVSQAMDDNKECERIYKKGLKTFPSSGQLYNAYGELLWSRQDYSAIRQWEKGIESEPNYSGNYYNACKYYYFTTDKIWSLIYGEVFVNMESFSRRTVEIKEILLESYKKLFTESDIKKGQDLKNPFIGAFLENMSHQTDVVSKGITPETLTMIRTRFILSWFEKDGDRYPYRLFDFQRQLLREGIFDAYNQWLFGPAQNLSAFENWTKTHQEEYRQFNNSQANRMFKMPAGQYYQLPGK
jgi:tetratricopeptide (TPR) repeat protein